MDMQRLCATHWKKPQTEVTCKQTLNIRSTQAPSHTQREELTKVHGHGRFGMLRGGSWFFWLKTFRKSLQGHGVNDKDQVGRERVNDKHRMQRWQALEASGLISTMC